MFSLVKFDNEECEVIPSNRVRVVQGTDCLVRYKNGAKYHAYLLKTAGTKEQLIKLLENIQQDGGNNRESENIEQDHSSSPELISPKDIEQDSSISQLPLPKKIEEDNVNSGKSTPSRNINHDTTDNRESPSPENIQVDTTHNLESISQENIQEDNVNNRDLIMVTSSVDDIDAINSTFVIHKQPFSNDTSTPQSASQSNGFFKELAMLDILDSSSVNASMSSEAPSGMTEINNAIGDSWLGVSEHSYEDVNKRLFTNGHSEKPNAHESSSVTNSIMVDDNFSKDSDYHPDPSTTNNNDTVQSLTNISQAEKSSLLDEAPAVDIRDLKIISSEKKDGNHTKKHFCLYCNTLQTKFARHLTLKHKQEADVKKFIHLPPQCLERKKIIEAIRRRGDYLHNTQPDLNTGILILCRQRQTSSKNCAEDYICCKKCKGFFSKATLRIHYSKCDKHHKKGVREITAAGRRLAGYIHDQANEVLRRIVFPVLRDDDVTRSIKYDRLIILYGNKLCDKYTLEHQHDMIRAYLRLLGRYKLAMVEIDKEVSDFASIFKPQRFDAAVLALRHVAHWDSKAMWFKTPAVANNMTTLIKKIGQKWKSECIKAQNYSQKTDVDDFLLLWTEEISVLINKKAQEDQILQKRQKKIILPSKQDIKSLYEYLKKEANIAYELLQESFCSDAWKLLNECTLVLIQIFNRRRAGEIERLKLADYKNRQKLDDNINEDLCGNLSEETKKYAQQFVRLTLRGKLDRTVSVLLSPFVTEHIETLLKYRNHAGIKDDNDHVFAVPNTNPLKKKYIRACPLLKRFSNECGANIPSALRGTTLRKHIATFTAMLDIENTQVDRLANFMGHHKDIHKNIYRMSVPVAEMTDVSRLLVAAMGGDEHYEDESEVENSDSSVDDDSSDINNNNDDNNTYRIQSRPRNAPRPENDGASDKNSNILDNNSDSAPSPTPRTSTRRKSRVNISDSESELESSIPVPTSAKRKSRSISPFGKTKRIRWSDEERRAVTKCFGNLKILKRLPYLQQCQDAIRKYRVLRNRVPQQLKTWIDNQRKAESRRATYSRTNL